MAHRFRGFCLGWRRAEMLAALPHSKTQGRGARGAFSGSGFALCFTFQPLSVLRPCPAPCALKVAEESGLAVRFGSFVCYRLELARRSHHVRIGAHFGRCRRCRGTTIVFWLSLSVLPHGLYVPALACGAVTGASTLAVLSRRGSPAPRRALGGPPPLLALGCSQRSHRLTVQAASAHRCCGAMPLHDFLSAGASCSGLALGALPPLGWLFASLRRLLWSFARTRASPYPAAAARARCKMLSRPLAISRFS